MRRSVKRKSTRAAQRQQAAQEIGPAVHSTEQVYRVGPGHPPKQYQWKPGQSGNPTGGKRKDKLADNLKALLERALNEKIELKRGERAQIITKLEAGFKELASQFAEGDSRARRDLFDVAAKLGIDLTAGRDSDHHVDVSSEAELRQALFDRGIPARLFPPIDAAGLEPPRDPPLPADIEEEPNQ